eukprot:SAG11_NODE_1636_length_4537_cov_2.667868_4_plen_1142_part_00
MSSIGDGGCYGYNLHPEPAPCGAGHQCVTLNASAWCKVCPASQVSSWVAGVGHTCVSCAEGFAPSADQGSCEPCSAGLHSATGAACLACPAGTFSHDAVHCVGCPAGYSSVPGSSGCTLCARGYYATRNVMNSTCKPCSEIVINPSHDQNARFMARPRVGDLDACLGGARFDSEQGRASRQLAGVDLPLATIRPFKDHWIHYDRNGDAKLLLCESRGACRSMVDSEQSNEGNLTHANAICGDHHTGFKCASCMTAADPPNYVDYRMIRGSCVECDGFNYWMALVAFGNAVVVSVFLLFLSTVPSISEKEIGLVWDKVARGQTEVLPHKIRKMLWMMGVVVRGQMKQEESLVNLIMRLREANEGLSIKEESAGRRELKVEVAQLIHTVGDKQTVEILVQRAKKHGATRAQIFYTSLSVQAKGFVDSILEAEGSADTVQLDGLLDDLEAMDEVALEKRARGLKRDRRRRTAVLDLYGRRAADYKEIEHPNTIVLDDANILMQYNGVCNEKDMLIGLLAQLSESDHELEEHENVTQLRDAELEAARPKLTIAKDDFIRVQANQANSAAVGILIFFSQTLALILGDQASAAEVGDLDAQKVSGKCLTNASTPVLFMTKVLWQPVSYIVGCQLIAPLIWKFLRRHVSNKVWQVVQAPPTLKSVHRYRAMLNVFLAVYAPVTRMSLQMLICKRTCPEGDPSTDCVSVVSNDSSIVCWSGAHLACAWVAGLMLFFYCILIPAALMRSASHSLHKRTQLLALDPDSADVVFDQLDEDKNGTLDKGEFKQLLHMLHLARGTNVGKTFEEIQQLVKETKTLGDSRRRLKHEEDMHENSETKLQALKVSQLMTRAKDAGVEDDAMETALESAHSRDELIQLILSNKGAGGDGVEGALESINENCQIDKESFRVWYESSLCSEISSSPCDVLYCTLERKLTWWFLKELFLKVLINVLYLMRFQIRWDQWLNCALLGSGSLLILLEPYQSPRDQKLEAAVHLSIMFVVQTVVSYPSFDDEPIAWLYTAVGILIPFTIFVKFAIDIQVRNKRGLEAYAAYDGLKAYEGLKAHGHVSLAQCFCTACAYFVYKHCPAQFPHDCLCPVACAGLMLLPRRSTARSRTTRRFKLLAPRDRPRLSTCKVTAGLSRRPIPIR